jgi:hypothetical protein
MELSRPIYELRDGEWQDVGARPAKRRGTLLRGLGALLGTACVVACIAAIGILATGAALLLSPVALLAVWLLKAIPAQSMDARRSG